MSIENGESKYSEIVSESFHELLKIKSPRIKKYIKSKAMYLKTTTCITGNWKTPKAWKIVRANKKKRWLTYKKKNLRLNANFYEKWL